MPSVQAPNIREAIYDFINAYIQPPIAEDAIIWGNQNDITLPENNNDYVIFWIINSLRHGTNINQYDADNELENISESNELVIQIDCYCDSTTGQDGTNAMLRAKSLEMLFRDGVATRFLKKYGMSALFAEDARDTTITGDSALLVRRWTVNAHIIVPITYSLEQEGFTSVQINQIKEVDSFYKD